MNDLKVFSSSEFGELGVMLIDGKEYFPAIRCAEILGYTNPRKAIRDRCKGGTSCSVPTNGGVQQMKFIPEGDLYRLIVSSKLPAAEKFERWVFDEVLPGIRKNGGYGSSCENDLSKEDIEKIVAVTAAEVVSKLVPAVVSAVLKNIPAVPETVGTDEKPRRRKAKSCRHRCVQPCKMELLPPDIKEQADEMIASGDFSCQQVANFVTNSTGEYISQMAVNNYRHKFFDVAEG